MRPLSDNVQNRGRMLEDFRWETEVARNSWAKIEDRDDLQEQGRGNKQERNAETVKSSAVHLVEWLCVEHPRRSM